MFKTGDRVVYTGSITSSWRGATGTVRNAESQDMIYVTWDDGDRRVAVIQESLSYIAPSPTEAKPELNDGARIPSPLPNDSKERKQYALLSALFDYFPASLCAVAKHSVVSNEKHNPGEPVHWSRGKSDDHLDAAMRHILERDLEGAAWRILAALQMQLEAEGAPIAPAAK